MVYYPIPAHKQKMFAAFGLEDQDLPITNELTSKVISLPIHTEMEEEQLEYICAQIKTFFNN
jgi:dTDP-4-amino-4,6-dideoxygalactose transaminase